MSEEKEKPSPKLDFKDIQLFKSVKIKLDSAEAVVSKEGQYGLWYLWFGYVENQKVWEGRGKESTPLEDYTGKVIFFPTEKLNEQLVKLADGNLEVEVSVTKEAEETKRGLIKRYVAKKLSEGRPPTASLTPSEAKLMGDVEELINSGYKLTEGDVITASKDKKYGDISEDKARRIYEAIVK